ncbi:amidohydrolase family protein [Vallitalea maricola]|uniref:Amidohydrolase family protein n=1 Tax=Vallitalea maricola TaxID=3074433 RepID=A0ACB5UGX5_9FIRM|nr:amidohydrolase family protein [Vallitalea sp. AN17-2]
MVIDSHQHLMLPTEFQIEKLDKAGIDKVILFCTTPHPERAKTLLELKREIESLYKILAGSNTKASDMQRMKNNIQELTQILHKYPDRFYGFGSVPLELSLEDTIDWIDRYIVSNGLKGIGEFTPGSDKQVQQLETVFQALEQYPQLPIWVHTFNPVSLSGIKILMELTKKFPKVSVIYGHMGGYYWMEVIDFAKTVSNAYIDLSAAFSTLAARMAVAELPEKCLYSSDAPYGEPLLSKQLIEYISPSDEIRDKILGGNILKLIGEENI